MMYKLSREEPMKMVFEMDDRQRKNLLGFLERVDLKGSEVPAFVEVVRILNGGEDNGSDH